MTKRITLIGLLGVVLGALAAGAQDEPVAGMKPDSAGSHDASRVGITAPPGRASIYAVEGLSRRLVLSVGVDAPSSDIGRGDAGGLQLAYPMQPVSGSFSVLPDITFLGQAVPWGWAADLYATAWLGQNDIGYRLGNRYQSSMTVARELARGLSVTTGARGEVWDNIQGADPLHDPTGETTRDPRLLGGSRISALLGFSFHLPGGAFRGQQLHLLGEAPVVQSLDGPQLKRNRVIRVGWQLEF